MSNLNGGGPNFEDDIQNFINTFKKHFKTVSSIFIVVALIFLVKSTIYTVKTEEEAIVLRLGRYIETTSPGLHFKLPLFDQVQKVKTTIVHQAEFGFRTRGASSLRRSSYSSGNYDYESLMLTGDLNVADVEWVVQYKISDPFKYRFKTSNPERNIRDISESIMRRVVGDKLVTEVLTTGRVEISSKAKQLMQEVIDKYDMGISVQTVKLQDVNPPDSVKASFNEVNEARQEKEKVINLAERKYNEIIPEAKGKAEKLLSEAAGYGLAKVNNSKGDSSKFLSLLKEYRRAPAITKKRIYLETMEKVFLKAKDINIVDSKIRGLLPIFQSAMKESKE